MRLHPLEPLSADEVRQVVSILKAEGKVTPTTRIVSISLNEPAKDLVNEGETNLPRSAFSVLFNNATNSCFEALVSLTEAKLDSWKHIPGVQSMITIDEMAECEQAVINSPEFKEALKKHCGLNDTSLVMVDIWTAGYYGSEEEKTRRLARPLCFVRSDPTDNGYAHPIEGIRPVVDLNEMKVLRVEEYGIWELPPGEANYAAARVPRLREDIKPLIINQPNGPSFHVDGYKVSWQKWKFVIGFNAREGLTLHDLRYTDEVKERLILYRASLTDLVVPYGDPGMTQARKNGFDVGEAGIGLCAGSLRLGCDCVGFIHYFDAHLCDSRGNNLTISNAICMHEEDYGILWKHTDRRLPDSPEVRRSRRLVISSISTVENYEYGFFWYLYQDGSIQFEVKLTGILSLGAFPKGEKPKYGTLVSPQLYAPSHQHFFNVRLDFNIDGSKNSVYQIDVVPDEIGPDNPFENAFQAKPKLLKSEKQARAHLNLETARTWKVVNEACKNNVGEPVGYKLVPGDNGIPMGSPNAFWRRRASFVNYHIWVTPFNGLERFGSGEYPNQSTGGDGLLKWTEEDRNVENTDLVMWYMFCHTHIPRIEDYPVMPTVYIGFMLKPNGFFAMNPAIDVPPSNAKNNCCP